MEEDTLKKIEERLDHLAIDISRIHTNTLSLMKTEDGYKSETTRKLNNGITYRKDELGCLVDDEIPQGSLVICKSIMPFLYSTCKFRIGWFKRFEAMRVVIADLETFDEYSLSLDEYVCNFFQELPRKKV